MKNNLPFGRCPFHNSSHHCVVLVVLLCTPVRSSMCFSFSYSSQLFLHTHNSLHCHTHSSVTHNNSFTRNFVTHTRTFHTLSHTHNSFTYNIVTYNSFKHTHPPSHTRTHARRSQHCHTQQLFLHAQLCHTSGDRRGLW